jgi:hypothetical protein
MTISRQDLEDLLESAAEYLRTESQNLANHNFVQSSMKCFSISCALKTLRMLILNNDPTFLKFYSPPADILKFAEKFGVDDAAAIEAVGWKERIA